MSEKFRSLSEVSAVWLANQAKGDLLRTPKVLSSHGLSAEVDGQHVHVFCSNDYLGLAAHPDVIAAQTRALITNAAAPASRLVSGTTLAHRQAEAALAAHVGRESALLFTSGYVANLSAISTLWGDGDVIFSDALNHASIIDGCRLSRADVVVYEHADLDSLRSRLAEHRSRAKRALVITEAVYSMDGDLAPLREIADLAAEFGADLYVDEAHSIGIMGPKGAGACSALNVDPDVMLGTLGKSFGLTGAFIAGTASVISRLENAARGFVYSTAISPAVISGVPKALELVCEADAARDRLRAISRRVSRSLDGCDETTLPILVVSCEGERHAMDMSRALLELGFFVQAIRPPTVPKGTSRLRLTMSAAHSDHVIDALVEAIEVARGRCT